MPHRVSRLAFPKQTNGDYQLECRTHAFDYLFPRRTWRECDLRVVRGRAVIATTNTGAAAWTQNLGAIVTAAPHFSEPRLTVGTSRNQVASLLALPGEISVVATTEHSPTAVASGTDGRYVIGDERGNLVLLNADGKQAWKFKNGAGSHSFLAKARIISPRLSTTLYIGFRGAGMWSGSAGSPAG